MPVNESIDDYIDAFRSYAALPTVTSALVTTYADSIVVHTTLSNRSFTSLKHETSTQAHFLTRQHDRLGLLATTPPTPLGSNILHYGITPSARRVAVFRKVNEGIKLQVLEGSILLAERIIPAETCSHLYTDATFGPPTWSTDEQHISFLGEFDTRKDLDKYRYQSDFGETFTGQRRPTVFIASLWRETTSWTISIRTVEQKEKLADVALAQASLTTQSGQLILFATGLSILGDGSRLGLVYCTNRASRIYRLAFSIDGGEGLIEDVEVSPVSPAHLSSRSPVLLDDRLTFLASETGGPHAGCASLWEVELRAGAGAREVVKRVEAPPPNTLFTGIYANALPRRPHLADYRLLINTVSRSAAAIVEVSLTSGAMQFRRPLRAGSATSCSVLNTDGKDLAVITSSSPGSSTRLSIARLSAGALVEEVDLLVQSSPTPLPACNTEIIQLDHFAATEVILISPSSAPTPPPLIVMPHGGPHSNFVADFSPINATLLQAGYALALVNYPGSTGYGEASNRSLIGNIGKLDVDAVRAAGKEAAKQLGLPSHAKLLLWGGSHGGFICAHLSARWPTEYAACVLRNPVTDLVAMTAVTDIPDWDYAEAGLSYAFESPPRSITPDAYAIFRKVSPITYLERLIPAHTNADWINVSPTLPPPTLLLLGAIDRRVPSGQGLAWLHTLRLIPGAIADCLIFPGTGHALDSVEAEVGSMRAVLEWFARYR